MFINHTLIHFIVHFLSYNVRHSTPHNNSFRLGQMFLPPCLVITDLGDVKTSELWRCQSGMNPFLQVRK